MPGLVADDLGRSLIPDNHRAGSAFLADVHALEISRRHVVVLDGHREPPDPRVKRRTPGHGPRAQHLARLNTEVVMQPRGVMQLHHEPLRREHALVCAGSRRQPDQLGAEVRDASDAKQAHSPRDLTGEYFRSTVDSPLTARHESKQVGASN